MKRRFKVLIALGAILSVLFVTVMVYFFGATYPDFNKIAAKSFNIPGLETKFVPQGMDYDSASGNFLVSGYMSNGESSRIYFVNKQSGQTVKYITVKVNGENYVGHAGGLAVHGEYLFMVGDGFLYRINLNSALALENGQSLEVIDGFETGNGADFVLVVDNKLIVGEFYKKGVYDTQETHHFVTKSGETNYALSFVYDIDHTKSYGIATTYPTAVISMPNEVQGMTFTKDGNIVLSMSYALPKSRISTYENVLNETPEQKTFGGYTVDYFELSNDNLIKTIKAPCMTQNIVLVEGKVYTLFESACKKYRLVVRTRLSNVYALDL